MKNITLILISLFTVGSCIGQEKTGDFNLKDANFEYSDYYIPVKVIFCWGQSNMDGYADTTTIDESYRGIQDSIYIRHILNSSTAAISQYHAGVNTSGTGNNGLFGPELSLAISLKDSLQEPIYIFKAARGGAALFQSPSVDLDWNPSSTGELLDITETAWANFVDTLLSRGLKPDIIGYFIMQGEAEADYSLEEAQQWAENCELIMKEIRRFTKNVKSRFLIGRIASWLSRTFKNTVRQEQEYYAAKHFNTYYVSTDDLSSIGDNVHFNASSLISLGLSFYYATTTP